MRTICIWLDISCELSAYVLIFHVNHLPADDSHEISNHINSNKRFFKIYSALISLMMLSSYQVDLSLSMGTAFTIFHHHLIYMLEHIMPKSERRVFNSLASTSAVIEYLQMNYGIGIT